MRIGTLYECLGKPRRVIIRSSKTISTFSTSTAKIGEGSMYAISVPRSTTVRKRVNYEDLETEIVAGRVSSC